MGYGLCRDGVDETAAVRTVLLASADAQFRAKLRGELTRLRWQVREASGGAEALAKLEAQAAEAMVLDSVLPDLEVSEFASQMRHRHPVMDLVRVGAADEGGARSPRRNELLHALRQAQDSSLGEGVAHGCDGKCRLAAEMSGALAVQELTERIRGNGVEAGVLGDEPGEPLTASHPAVEVLPGMVGGASGMLEMAHMVRLVARRLTTVLIQGETGTGKELVARAVHDLSCRANKPFVVLNCAAIPEALLEAELFGHTRGAFTGAVQSRAGRIEAAHGGTLFLDEIGEMPLALQAKMLRFLESGELQRVGNNEMLRVDVRVVAASHQPLQERAKEGGFRLDLYHRLAVFPILLPPLRERMEDVMPLAEYLLTKLGEKMPAKRLTEGAAARLMNYDWPGNVRELAHVLERGAILAEDRREITSAEIRW